MAINVRGVRIVLLVCFLLLVSGLWTPLPSAQPAARAATASQLTLLGRLEFPDKHPATEVVVAGRYAYVAANDARFEGWGLRVVDVINPQAPQLVGVYNIPHAPGETGQVPDLALNGNYVYLANGFDGLHVVDVSNPRAPVGVRTITFPAGAYVLDVTLAGGYAYVVAEESGLHILDVSDPALPVPVGLVADSAARVVRIVGSYAYLTNVITVRIVDVSNPAAPVEVGSYEATLPITGIDVEGTVAYVTYAYCLRACTGGLEVVDVSNPASPVKLGSEGESLNRPFGPIEVVGRYALVGVNYGCSSISGVCSGALRVVDVANPAAPAFVTDFLLGDGPTGIAVVGNLIYVTDETPDAFTSAGRLSILRYPALLTQLLTQKSYLSLVNK